MNKIKQTEAPLKKVEKEIKKSSNSTPKLKTSIRSKSEQNQPVEEKLVAPVSETLLN